MVKTFSRPKGDYAKEHDRYWSNTDRFRETNPELSMLSDHIVMSCGVAKVLDVGSGEGILVRELLKRGVDAYGLDVSRTVVDYCNRRMPGRFAQGSILELPFEDGAFLTIVSTNCLEWLALEDIPQALTEIYRVARRYVFLRIGTAQNSVGQKQTTVEGRAWWERQCLEAGFRKHPAYYVINHYESLNHDSGEIYILLEKIPSNALLQYPLAALAVERDLHMDMLRETGSRSDAHVGRYHFASKYIRPGDVVLDAACGLGYGTYVLSTLSAGTTFLGIDGSTYAIDYANTNFSVSNRVEFLPGYLPECLASLQDSSFDVIISFETLEHVENPQELLKEFSRILTPGGRLIVSVPNDWSDESGEDPNPYHFHVNDIQTFQAQLNSYFEIEHLYGQTADRVKLHGKECEWAPRSRTLTEVDLCNPVQNFESEWLLAVAAKSPLQGRSVPYVEKMFSPTEVDVAGNALSFGRDYENPWLIKSLISIGIRTENKSLRAKWAREVLEVSSPTSADRGAALCILAYLSLEGISIMTTDSLLFMIDQYVNNCRDEKNPSTFRWSVSLKYVQALISLNNGNREDAKQFLAWGSTAPILSYHATLLTKAAESAYQRGVMAAADNDFNMAQSIWRDGFRMLSQALAQHLSHGYTELPPDFEIRELSCALALIGRLCTAAKYSHDIKHRPMLFYNQCNADFIAQQKENQTYIAELLASNNWLESQWRALRQELSQREAELAEVWAAKNWLETQWQTSQEQLTRIKNSFFFRLVRKFTGAKNL